MHLFELILTDSCTRNCNFCQIPKSIYKETKENIKHFYDLIHHEDEYEISLFGGEPLLNYDVMEYTIKMFNDEKCKITLYTNGDLIDRVYNKWFLNRIFIQITAYDIFENVQKYVDMMNNLNSSRVIFSYTFTDKDIHRVSEYINICENNKLPYKFALSHTNSSWNNIADDELYSIITEITEQELLKSMKNGNLTKFIENKFKRCIEFNTGKCKKIYCVSDSKKVFYKGKFIGPCMMLQKNHIKLTNKCQRCNKCQYDTLCTKSCYYEFIDNEVPNKLCIIEKVQFDILFKYFKKMSNSRIIQSVVLIKEAVNELRPIYPELSDSLLNVCNALMTNINPEETQEFQNLVENTISNAEK